MISVGETLRRERLRRNLELDQISQELKISEKFLGAIEAEDYDKLPAGMFAKSFVRQYARLLDLDEDELAAEVQRTLQPHSTHASATESAVLPPPDIQVPRVDSWEGGVPVERPFSWSSSLPALAGVVVVMLICSIVYSWWQRSRRPVTAYERPSGAAAETTRVSPAAPPAVAQNPPAAPDPAAIPAVPPAAVSEQPQPTATNATPAPDTATAQAQPPPKAQQAPAPVKPSTPPEESSQSAPKPMPAAGNPNAPVRVELTAGEPVWVLAQNDGKYLFSGTLEPNQTRTVEAKGTVTLRLGNAGGVSITLNGKPIGAVGPRGQVRTVQFTSGGFHIVSAPSAPVPLADRL